jgi:hypothetical protein
MTYTPDPGLEYGQTYQVTISTAAQDLTDNSLETDHVFSFTTAAETDTAPIVSSTSRFMKRLMYR